MKIALLSSYTVDFLPKETDKFLNGFNLTAEWHVAPFNQYRQEILNPNSDVHRFQPQIILLSVDVDDIFSAPQEFMDLLKTASENFSGSTILVHNFSFSRNEPMKLLEWNSPESRQFLVNQINSRLSESAMSLPNVFVLDYAGLIKEIGAETFFDKRYYYLAKAPFSAAGNQKIAQQFATAIATVVGKRKKCLVLDLDNTLWGGIVGEDGIENIQLSNDGLGKAFYDFQKNIDKLYKNGVILALCSKNEPSIALAALREHPYMILREEKFSAIYVNWLDKAENLRSIAKELNIGLDSMVFLDDSEHERALVRESLPEVFVPDLPQDATDYPDFIARLDCFEALSITAEDQERGKLYAQERKRVELQKSSKTFEEFLNSLNIVVAIKTADNFSIPRVAQLTQKTNQFNFTTRRYTDGDITTLLKNDKYKILYISAKDRLGDSGIVGVAIIENNGRKARLDTFLISCRVLGRGIEQAFLGTIFKQLANSGVDLLEIEFTPTAKNKIASDFLEKQHFERADFGWVVPSSLDIFPRWVTLESYE